MDIDYWGHYKGYYRGATCLNVRLPTSRVFVAEIRRGPRHLTDRLEIFIGESQRTPRQSEEEAVKSNIFLFFVFHCVSVFFRVHDDCVYVLMCVCVSMSVCLHVSVRVFLGASPDHAVKLFLGFWMPFLPGSESITGRDSSLSNVDEGRLGTLLSQGRCDAISTEEQSATLRAHRHTCFAAQWARKPNVSSLACCSVANCMLTELSGYDYSIDHFK